MRAVNKANDYYVFFFAEKKKKITMFIHVHHISVQISFPKHKVPKRTAATNKKVFFSKFLVKI